VGVAVGLVSAVMAVYEAAQIVVRTAKGDSKVHVSVRLHTLSGEKRSITEIIEQCQVDGIFKNTGSFAGPAILIAQMTSVFLRLFSIIS